MRIPSSFSNNPKSDPLTWSPVDSGDSVSSKKLVTPTGAEYTVFSYPAELGQTRYPYYMVFYINAQSKSKLVESGRVGTQSNTEMNRTVGTGGVNIAQKMINETKPGSVAGTLTSFAATKKRLTLAMALPMPNNVSNNSTAQYNTIDTGVFGSALASYDNEGMTGAMKEIAKAAVQNIPEVIAKAAGVEESTIKNFTQVKNKLLGLAKIDRKEMMFQNMEMRTFRFEWLLIPQTEEESATIRDIIKFMRFNMYPEISADPKTENGQSEAATGGFYVTIPNEFDIEFHYVDGDGIDSEMEGITKITTCVLTDVTVDYTPLGKFVGYDGTDNPVAIQLSLTFKEVEPLTRAQVALGF